MRSENRSRVIGLQRGRGRLDRHGVEQLRLPLKGGRGLREPLAQVVVRTGACDAVAAAGEIVQALGKGGRHEQGFPGAADTPRGR